jgi:hypothetical protein
MLGSSPSKSQGETQGTGELAALYYFVFAGGGAWSLDAL